MHPFWILLARLVLGTVWLAAGLSKHLDASSRTNSVEEFGLLPRRVARAVGFLLPWAELALGLLILAGLWLATAVLVSTGMLTLFSLAVSINLLRGRRIACHCFGQLSQARISWLTVIRNAALLMLGLAIAQSHSSYLTVAGWLRGTAIRPTDPSVLEFVPVLFITLGLVLAWILMDQAWRAAKAMAKAIEGPALGSSERIYLRRLLRLDMD